MKKYAQEIADLEASELSAANKACLYNTIIAQRDAAITKTTATHERWVAGMRAAEASASSMSAGMATATAVANSWAGALGKVYKLPRCMRGFFLNQNNARKKHQYEL